MSTLNRGSILEAMTLKIKRVPLGDGEVIVSEINGTDYMKLWSDPRFQKKDEATGKDTIDYIAFIPALIAYSVLDEESNRVFSDDDIPLIAKSAQGTFLTLSNAAREVNGLSGDEIKNSNASLNDSTSLDSQLPLDIGIQNT